MYKMAPLNLQGDWGGAGIILRTCLGDPVVDSQKYFENMEFLD